MRNTGHIDISWKCCFDVCNDSYKKISQLCCDNVLQHEYKQYMMITTQRLWLHVFLKRQSTLSEQTYNIAVPSS